MGPVNCVNREAKYVGDITFLSSCHVVLGSHLFKESLNIYLAVQVKVVSKRWLQASYLTCYLIK